jgi:glutaredoxin 3
MAKVEIYTTPYCPYCIRAKALLQRKGVTYREIDVTGAPELRRWLRERTGRRTVPQIFVNGQPLGGYDDIAALDREGRLDSLLTLPDAAG